jgi:hypothetical protein
MDKSYTNYPSQQTFKDNVRNKYNDKNDHNEQKNIIKIQQQRELGKIPQNYNQIATDEIVQTIRYQTPINNNAKIQSSINNQSINTSEYNPYYEYLSKKGILNGDYKVHVITNNINIDSESRVINTKITTDDIIILDNNPISYQTETLSSGLITATASFLTINNANHGLVKNDKILLSGIVLNPIKFKTKYIDPDDNISKYATILSVNSSSLIIKTSFDNTTSNASVKLMNNNENINFVVGDGITYEDLKNYDTSDMTISFSGFTGTNDFIGNIPVNFLNATHRIYFSNPDPDNLNYDTIINVPSSGIVKKITGFYIKLNEKYIGTTDIDSTVTLTYNHIGGIPLTHLNAFLPVSKSNTSAFHTIYDVPNNNQIRIKLSKIAHYISPTPKINDYLGQIPIQFGGNRVECYKITEIITGYRNPNSYQITLQKPIRNVIMAKLINSNFINTIPAFIGTNKLYFQIKDDGDIEYSISIDEGTYEESILQKILEDKIYELVRQNINTVTSGYSDKIKMEVSINKESHIVIFKAYKEVILSEPITNIYPSISTTPVVGVQSYTLTITHVNHKLSVGDTVTFSNFSNTTGIPSIILNTTHTVISVLGTSTYTIIIKNFNLLPSERIESKGGHSAKINVPIEFRLLFDKPDTIGRRLGFRNVGDKLSITNFGKVITNKDEYEYETKITDENGNNFINYLQDGTLDTIRLERNILDLHANNYFLMKIRELPGLINLSLKDQSDLTLDEQIKIKECFAKIIVSGNLGSHMINTFVKTKESYFNMIDLNELTINFYTSQGELVEFYGHNHSFVLEITSLDTLPLDTYIDTQHNTL